MNLFEFSVYVVTNSNKRIIAIKKVFVICLGLLLLSCTPAKTDQLKPEKVYRITYEIKPNDWYQTQSKLWKAILEKNPQNAEAWHNYYNANRYAHFENVESDEKQATLQKIIDDMGKAIPNTFDYYFLHYWNSHNVKDISVLEKAYEIDPNRPDAYYGFISHYEILGQFDKAKEFYQKLYASQDIAQWLLDYNNNMLMSVEEKAILVTNGDNDTYPARMLQEIKNVRPDVTILNISMSPEKEYLMANLNKRNIKLDIDEIQKKAKNEKGFSRKLFLLNLVEKLELDYPEIPVYFASTVYSKTIEEIKDELYMTGLALRHSKDRIDNTALLKKNLEKRFRIDGLDSEWYVEKEIGQNLRKGMQANYLPPMIMLVEHYDKSGESDKKHMWKDFALKLAFSINNEIAVKALEKF